MWKVLKRGVLLKCGKSVKATSAVVNCDDLHKQNCHQLLEFSKFCNHWPSHSREYHSSYEDSGGGYHQAGPECKWKKQSFQCDIWSSTQGCWHLLEAVGWGTAVVTGLQITELCHRSSNRFDNGNRNKCWVKSLVNNATAVGWAEFSKLFSRYSLNTIARVIGNGLLTGKSMLPSRVQQSNPVPVNQFDSENNVPSAHILKPFTTTQSDTTNVLRESVVGLSSAVSAFSSKHDVTDTPAKTDDELSWQTLAEQCVAAIQCNLDALAHIKQGEISAAVNLWKKSCSCPVCSPSSLFNLALCYEHGLGVNQDIEKASNLYGKAAEMGHAKSAFNLAMLLLKDDDSSANNFQKAVELLHKAADMNLKEAQRELGVLYMEPTLQDMTKAVALFEQAFSQKDARATYFLGICYERGWGVDRNEVKAANLYKIAGTLGHIDALYNLAVFFENGFGGLPVDLYEAIHYYEAAASAGHKPAADRLVILNNQQLPQKTVVAEGVKGNPSTDSKSTITSTDSSTFSPISRTRRFSMSSDTDWSEYSSISDSDLSNSSTNSSMWQLSSAKGLPNVFFLQPSNSVDSMVSSRGHYERCEMASSPDEGNQSLGNRSFEAVSTDCSPTLSDTECGISWLPKGTFGEVILPHMASLG